MGHRRGVLVEFAGSKSYAFVKSGIWYAGWVIVFEGFALGAWYGLGRSSRTESDSHKALLLNYFICFKS